VIIGQLQATWRVEFARPKHDTGALSAGCERLGFVLTSKPGMATKPQACGLNTRKPEGFKRNATHVAA
jgi:hypothetical protein